jgi:hydrogenase expression/formation protein HypC
MCLGIPGRIIEIYETNGLKMGKLTSGVIEACLAYLPEALIGVYTMVHVGFGLNIIDEEEAQLTLELLS